MAPIGPANGARLRPAEVRPVKNQLSEAEIGVNFTAEKALVRGPWKAGRRSRPHILFTVGVPRSSLKYARGFGQSSGGWSVRCGLTGLFRLFPYLRRRE